MRILVLGATGLLGSFLKHYLQKKTYIKIFPTGFAKKSKYYLNLLDRNSVLKFFKSKKPDVIINCAAQTNVDECQKNFYFGYKGNVLIVKNIVLAIKQLKFKPHFIHFSTDQVYNNKGKRKNSEHQINLTNNYSITKYLGELEAKKIIRSTIIRTNFFGKSFLKKRRTFSGFVIHNLLKGKKVRVPANIIYNPVSLDYIARILELIILKKKIGIYNLGSRDSISKYNFCTMLQKRYDLNPNLVIRYLSNYYKDKRPLNTSLSSKKLEKSLGIKVPFIKDMI